MILYAKLSYPLEGSYSHEVKAQLLARLGGAPDAALAWAKRPFAGH